MPKRIHAAHPGAGRIGQPYSDAEIHAPAEGHKENTRMLKLRRPGCGPHTTRIWLDVGGRLRPCDLEAANLAIPPSLASKMAAMPAVSRQHQMMRPSTGHIGSHT